MADNPFARFAPQGVAVTNDNPFAKFAQPQQSAPEAPKPNVGILESIGRGFVEGGTFGFEDELGLADKTKQQNSRSANPVSHFVGELAGSIVPMAAATLLPTGAGQAAAAGRGAQLLNKGSRIVRGMLAPAAPSTMGQAVGQGVKMGATYGAISGAGHAEDGERLKGASEGLVSGAVVGGALAPVGYKIGEKLAIARAAKNEMANSDTASLSAIDRALARDRIDPATLRGQIEVPQYGKLATDDITKVATLASEGRSSAEIAQTLGVGEKTVRDALQRFNQQNATPLSIVDRARLTSPAGGENTSWTLRAGMASPGEGRAVAAEALTQRQMGQSARLSDAADNIVSAGDPAVRAQAMKAAETGAYGNAFSKQQPFDIRPTVDAIETQFGGRQTEIAKTMRQAGELFSEKTPGRPPQFRPFDNLQHFQEAKIDLDQMIANSMNMGRPTPLTKRLMDYKTNLMNEVTRTNPEWRKANDLFAENATARRLFQDIETTGFRITPDSKKELASISQAYKTAGARNVAPEAKAAAKAQIEMAKDGLAEAVRMLAMNKGETADHVSKLLTPAAQQFAKTILGPKDGAAFIKALRAEEAITRTYRGLGGSQTTPLREAIDELNGPALLASAWDMANPRKLLEALVIKGQAKYSEARNNRMVPMMVESDPIKQLGMLRSVEQMRKARTSGGGVGLGMIAPISNATIGAARPTAEIR